MNVLETDWWAMVLPPEWWGEAEEDSILVGDNDDVGCIEISTLRKDEGSFGLHELHSIAQSESPAGLHWREVSVGDFRGWNSSLVEEGAAIREWYLGNGAVMLYVTYSCDEDNRGMDDAAVDDLLDSLVVAEPEPEPE